MMKVVDSKFNSDVVLALGQLQSEILGVVASYDDSIRSLVAGFISQMGILGVEGHCPGLLKWVDIFKAVQEHQRSSKESKSDEGSSSARADCAMDMFSNIVAKDGFADTAKLCYLISQYAELPWITDRNMDNCMVLLDVEALAMDGFSIMSDLYESFMGFVERLNVLEEKVMSGFREIGKPQNLPQSSKSKSSEPKTPRFKLQDRVSCILRLTQVRSQLLVLGSKLVVCSICGYYLFNKSAKFWAGYDLAAEGRFVDYADKSIVVNCANMVVNCANKLLSNMAKVQVLREHSTVDGEDRFEHFLPEGLLNRVLIYDDSTAGKSELKALKGVIDIASSPLIDLMKILQRGHHVAAPGYVHEAQACDIVDVSQLSCLCRLNIAVDGSRNTFRNSIISFGEEVEIADSGSKIHCNHELSTENLRVLRSFMGIEERIVRTIRDMSASICSIYRGQTVSLNARVLRILLLHFGDCGNLLGKLSKSREFQAMPDRARFTPSERADTFKRVQFAPRAGNQEELMCWGVLNFSFTDLKLVIDDVMSAPHIFSSSEVFAKAVLNDIDIVPESEVQLRSFLQNQETQAQGLVSKGELVSVANFCAYHTRNNTAALPKGLEVRAVEKAAPGIGNNDATRGASHVLEIVCYDESEGHQEQAKPSKNFYSYPFIDQYKASVFTERLDMLQSMFAGMLLSDPLRNFLKMSSLSARLQDFMLDDVSNRVGEAEGAYIAPGRFSVRCIGSERHADEESDYFHCAFAAKESGVCTSNPTNKLGLFTVFNAQFSLLRKFLYCTEFLSNWRDLLENVHKMHKVLDDDNDDPCALMMTSRGTAPDFSILRQFVEHADALIFVADELLNHKANLERAYDPLIRELLHCSNNMNAITDLLIRYEVFLGPCELKKIYGPDIACSRVLLFSRLVAVCGSVKLLLNMNVAFVNKYLDDRAINVINLVMKRGNSEFFRSIRSLIGFENKINDLKSSLASEFQQVMNHILCDNEFLVEHARLCNSNKAHEAVTYADFKYLMSMSREDNLAFFNIQGIDQGDQGDNLKVHIGKIALGFDKVMRRVFDFFILANKSKKVCQKHYDSIVRGCESLGCARGKRRAEYDVIMGERDAIVRDFQVFVQGKRDAVIGALGSDYSISNMFFSQFFSYTHLRRQFAVGPFSGSTVTRVLDIPATGSGSMKILQGGYKIPKVPSGLRATMCLPKFGTKTDSEFLYPDIFIPRQICDRILGYADVSAADCFMIGVAKPAYAFASSMAPSSSMRAFAVMIDRIALARFVHFTSIVADIYRFIYPNGLNLDICNLDRYRNFLVEVNGNVGRAHAVSVREKFFSVVADSEHKLDSKSRLSAELETLQKRFSQLDKFFGAADDGFLTFLNSLLREVDWSSFCKKKYSKPLERFSVMESYCMSGSNSPIECTLVQDNLAKVWDDINCNIFTGLKNCTSDAEYECIYHGLDAVPSITNFDMEATRRAYNHTGFTYLGDRANDDERAFVHEVIEHCKGPSVDLPVHLPFPTIDVCDVECGGDPLLTWNECFHDVFPALNEEFCKGAYRVMFANGKVEACHNIIGISRQQQEFSKGVAKDFEHSGVFADLFNPYCVLYANIGVVKIHGQLDRAHGESMKALHDLLEATLSAYHILYWVQEYKRLWEPIRQSAFRKPLHASQVIRPVEIRIEDFCATARSVQERYNAVLVAAAAMKFFHRRIAKDQEGGGIDVVLRVVRDVLNNLDSAIASIDHDLSALQRTDAEARTKFCYFKIVSSESAVNGVQMQYGGIEDVITAMRSTASCLRELFDEDKIAREFGEDHDNTVHYQRYWAAGVSVMFGVFAKHQHYFGKLYPVIHRTVAERVKNQRCMGVAILANMLAVCHKACEASLGWLPNGEEFAMYTAVSRDASYINPMVQLKPCYDKVCEFENGDDIDDVVSSSQESELNDSVELEAVSVLLPEVRERVVVSADPSTSVEKAECIGVSTRHLGRGDELADAQVLHAGV